MKPSQAINIAVDIPTTQAELILKAGMLTVILILLQQHPIPKRLAELNLAGQVLLWRQFQDGK